MFIEIVVGEQIREPWVYYWFEQEFIPDIKIC